MAVTITDNRTTIDTADSVTGWTGNSPTLITTFFSEATASVGDQLTITTGDLFFTPSGSIDLSNSLIYTRSANTALQNSWTTEVHALYLTDGTDEIAFHEAGNDRDVFKHADGEVGFQSFVLDGAYAATKDAAGETTAIAGSFAALDLTAITAIGSHFITLSKALGGGQNVYCDIIRHDETGHDGITITGGTPADPGQFSEVAVADRSTADLAGHGVFREYTSGIFGVQGTLRFGGQNAASEDTFFIDQNVVVAYEDRDVNDDKFWFYLQGTESRNVTFYLRNSTVTTAGPKVRSFFSDAGIDQFELDGVTFTGLGRTMEFADDAHSSAHKVQNCTFNDIGMIDPGTVNFNDNSFTNIADKLGGLLIDGDGTTRISNLTFTSDGTGHAFYIHTPGSYTLNNWLYAGFGADDTTDATAYNDSKGAVTLTITNDGDSPSVRNGAGASTTIVNTVQLTVTVVDIAGDPIQNARVAIYDDPEGVGETELMNELTTAGGIATESFNFTGDTTVSVRVRKGSTTDDPKYVPVNSSQNVTSAGLTVTITMLADPNNNA